MRLFKIITYMSHITKFGTFQECEPSLTICTQLKLFMSALLQPAGIQKHGLQGRHNLWERQKR